MTCLQSGSSLLPLLLLACSFTLLLLPSVTSVSTFLRAHSPPPSSSSSSQSSKVPITFYVMSRCPDAALCVSTFGSVVRQLQPIADTHFEYIGSESADGELECKHGKAECQGNMQQLCAQRIDQSTAMKWLDFVGCQSEQQEQIPDNAKQCADTTSIEWKELEKCYNNDGLQLLSNSFAASREAGVAVSCTIFIDNQQFCQHDGEWKDCPNGHEAGDLLKQVCAQYQGEDKEKVCQNGSSSEVQHQQQQ